VYPHRDILWARASLATLPPSCIVRRSTQNQALSALLFLYRGVLDQRCRGSTGVSLLTTELSGKRLELLAQVVRSLPRVAILMNPDNPVHRVFLEETRVAAQKLGAQLQPLEARHPNEIEAGFEAAAGERAGALVVFDDPVLWSHRKKIVALAAKRRRPVVYGYREFVDDGGLMSYGPDRVDHYRRTAVYVDKILRGARPADLPVEQPTKFELVINLKTAGALGLAIPPSLLLRADQVIQ
jgi:putative ABC transport system substrate-binding protein